MTDENKMYPILTEEGEQEAVKLLERFKKQMKEVIDEVGNKCISDFYANILPYIESDSWENYRNNICDAVEDYHNFKETDKYQAQRIRRELLKNNKKELIADLDKDLLEEIESLKSQLEYVLQNRHY